MDELVVDMPDTALTAPPTEEANPFEGMDFLQVFELLLGKAPSSDYGLDNFKAVMTAIQKVHDHFGLEFNQAEYWGPDKIRGSWPVFPPEVKPIEVPEVITEDAIRQFAAFQSDLQEITRQITLSFEQANQARQSNRDGNGQIEQRRLDGGIQRAPMYVPISDSEEDDFL